MNHNGFQQDNSVREDGTLNSQGNPGEEQICSSRSLNSRVNPGEEQICSSLKYKERANLVDSGEEQIYSSHKPKEYANSPWTPLGVNMSRIPEENEIHGNNHRMSNMQVNMANDSRFGQPVGFTPSAQTGKNNQMGQSNNFATPAGYNQSSVVNPSGQTQAMVTVAVQQPEKWGSRKDHRSISQFLREYENFARMMQWNRTYMIQRIENYLVESAFEWIQQVHITFKRNWNVFKCYEPVCRL